VIAHGTLVKGDVKSTGPIEIRGAVEGDCQTFARCIVHEGARVLGNIDAAALVVAGKVESGLITADKVELAASASVEGTIRARVLVVADGAYYKGDIEWTGDQGGPSLLKDRRRQEPEEPPEQ